jgi:nucleoside-diphosphate-sugar epimerase
MVGKMKRVFLTGATGFIGYHVARALVSRGNYRVSALVRESASPERREALKGMGVDIIEGSLEAVRDAAPRIRGSEVFCHLAALRGGGKGREQAYRRINVEATEDLLDLAFETGARRFVFCSSAGVFGTIPAGLPGTLETSPRGDCAYHRSKIDAEKRVLAWREKGLDTVIIRPVITYGEGDEGLPARLVNRVSRRRMPLPVPDITVHLLNVRNLAEWFMRVIDMEDTGGGIFIAADARPVSLGKLADTIYRTCRGRDYPPYLRMPAIIYRLAAGFAALAGMEKWQVRFRLFSASWYYRPGPLLPGQVLSDTEKAFPRFAAGLKEEKAGLLPIERNWRAYFSDPHEGLGTTYERFVLHRFFARIDQAHDIRRVVEVPSFGMTGVSGVNSLWWARQGKSVAVADHHRERLTMVRQVWDSLGLSADFARIEDYARLPFEDRYFSLGWNFCALWFVPDLAGFLAEMSRVTEKVIFICVPNRTGLGHRLRFLSGRPYRHIQPQHIRPERFTPILKKLGWRLEDRGFFDIPPWPDIAMKKEDFFKKLGWRGPGEQSGRKEREPLSILDYYAGKKEGMEADMKKYGFLERAPWPVNRLWAHHRYFIFTRGD